MFPSKIIVDNMLLYLFIISFLLIILITLFFYLYLILKINSLNILFYFLSNFDFHSLNFFLCISFS